MGRPPESSPGPGHYPFICSHAQLYESLYESLLIIGDFGFFLSPSTPDSLFKILWKLPSKSKAHWLSAQVATVTFRPILVCWFLDATLNRQYTAAYNAAARPTPAQPVLRRGSAPLPAIAPPLCSCSPASAPFSRGAPAQGVLQGSLAPVPFTATHTRPFSSAARLSKASSGEAPPL